MIGASDPLLSNDYKHLFLRDVMGRHGLFVIGVGKARERGIQMLYRFSYICERLDNWGATSSLSIGRNQRAMFRTPPPGWARATAKGHLSFWTMKVNSFVILLNLNRFARCISMRKCDSPIQLTSRYGTKFWIRCCALFLLRLPRVPCTEYHR